MYTPFPHYEISKSQSKGKPSSDEYLLKLERAESRRNFQ